MTLNQQERLFLKHYIEDKIADIRYDMKKYSYQRTGEYKENNLFKIQSFTKLIKLLK